MSYHELTRRELQTLCKQHGLPANKTNAVMASSLTSFFSDQQTITQAYAQVITPSSATKSVKTRALPKPERLETSLASLILASAKPCAKGGQDTLLKKCRELPEDRKPVAKSAYVDPSPADFADSTPLPNTTPLRRRRKKSDAIKNLPTVAEDTSSRGIAQDSTKNLRLLPEKNLISTIRTVVKKISTPELPLAPHPNADILVTDNQDCRNDVFTPGCLQPVLMGPLLRITANVDTLIRRATGMLEKFEQWKVDNPNGDVVHPSGQMHFSFDKENLYQQSPCKSSRAQSLQGYMGGSPTQLDWKEGILRDIVLNVHT